MHASAKRLDLRLLPSGLNSPHDIRLQSTQTRRCLERNILACEVSIVEYQFTFPATIEYFSAHGLELTRILGRAWVGLDISFFLDLEKIGGRNFISGNETSRDNTIIVIIDQLGGRGTTNGIVAVHFLVYGGLIYGIYFIFDCARGIKSI